MGRTFVGFGFGPIQSGLFLYEAFESGNFDRLVVAEVLPPVVEAVRGNGGRYKLNVATRTGIDIHEVTGVEILNPSVGGDADELIEALAEASEIATALPSISIFDKGDPSVAQLLAMAFRRKFTDHALPDCVVYAAENHNHAAEALERAVTAELGPAEAPALDGRVQFLNTVIGKMSGVVVDPQQIAQDHLAPMVKGWDRAFLLEAFNRILVSRIDLPEFERGIDVFIEKTDLLPFEEAKLYGHNATHALIGYLANRKGYPFMSDVSNDPELTDLARKAFLEESGRTLVARHKGVDDLFTEIGYRAYADDLLERMMNPYLRDQVARIIRDPRRKLGWDDRLIGTMRLAMDAGITPTRYATGAAAALTVLRAEEPGQDLDTLLASLWPEPDMPLGRKAAVRRLLETADLP